MALPKGDVAETYSYVTDTVGIIQDACGPRCTEALWANAQDGAQLIVHVQSVAAHASSLWSAKLQHARWGRIKRFSRKASRRAIKLGPRRTSFSEVAVPTRRAATLAAARRRCAIPTGMALFGRSMGHHA